MNDTFIIESQIPQNIISIANIIEWLYDNEKYVLDVIRFLHDHH